MKRIFAAAVLALGLAATPMASAQNNSGGLRIYWIDVEGGASTLIVAPNGQTLLFDTGFPTDDRDAKRIYATLQKAGVKQIDHLVISHWHADHVGGLPALAKMIPIGHFYDHGDGVEPADKARHDGYVALAGNKRTIVKVGDTIPLAGVNVLVVSSEFSVLNKTLPGGGPNPLCATATQMAPGAPENQRMVGLMIGYNDFKYLSLADLDWEKEMALACPENRLGHINLWLVSRHGTLADSGAPAFVGAIKPQVVVINNGPKKGLGQADDRAKPVTVAGVTPAPYEHNSFFRLAKLPGMEGIWQIHKSMLDQDPAHNTAPDMIANMDEGASDQGNGISATVAADGKFTITNARNGFSKTYTAH